MAETINREPFYQGRPGYEGMLNQVSHRADANLQPAGPCLD